jgi:hypothetical protein
VPEHWEMPEPIRLLGEYAVSYIREFNSIRGELLRAGAPASLYAEELTAASVLRGKDGIAVFYVTEKTREKSGLARGVEVQDVTDESLTRITQVATGNNLKIFEYQMGDSALTPPSIPEDLPEARGATNIEYLEPFVQRGAGCNLLGIAVGPTWHADEMGLIARSLPTRKHVFSPILPVPPDERPVIQFIFPFADLIWGLEDLKLDAEAGMHLARADVEVLLLGISAGVPPKQLFENPFESVAAHCERQCDGFFVMVDNPETREAEVQAFLERPENQFLIAPHAQGVFPHKPLGGNRFIPDFVVHRADGDYHFIEIESPNAPIYQKQGEEPTSYFNHAIVQVEDWLRYIDQNLLSIRNEDNMPTLYKPTGEVVIGRDKHLGDTARIRFQYKRAESPRIDYKTYDMLIKSGLAYAVSIRRLSGPARD